MNLFFLGKDCYCPFNSQNTYWHKDAFPYLYLPTATSFRFTDILRGYIAQKLMWDQNLYLGFCPANVYQKRNPHDLIEDFRAEVDCYLNVKPIVEILDAVQSDNCSIWNLAQVYLALSKYGFCRHEEVLSCQAWLRDLNHILNCA